MVCGVWVSTCVYVWCVWWVCTCVVWLRPYDVCGGGCAHVCMCGAVEAIWCVCGGCVHMCGVVWLRPYGVCVGCVHMCVCVVWLRPYGVCVGSVHMCVCTCSRVHACVYVHAYEDCKHTYVHCVH